AFSLIKRPDAAARSQPSGTCRASTAGARNRLAPGRPRASPLSRPCEPAARKKVLACLAHRTPKSLGGSIAVHLKLWLRHALAAVACSVTVTAAHANPLSSAAISNGASSQRDGIVAPVARRHCLPHHGRQQCRSRAYVPYNSGYYVRDADKLPFGTSIWWDQMLRENRAGNPGGGGRN